MDTVRLIKCDDAWAKEGDWDGISGMAEDLGLSEEDISDWWMLEEDDYDVVPASGSIETFEGIVVSHSRAYPVEVKGVVVKRTNTEIIVQVEDSSICS